MQAKPTINLDRDKLLKAAEDFCQAFAAQLPGDQLLKRFSTLHTPSVVEHDGVEHYFRTISGLLTYHDMRFWDYIVDPQVMKVSVKGQATFTWQHTGQSWSETFMYSLAFDEEFLVKNYEIWADTGAAYLASKGELNPT